MNDITYTLTYKDNVVQQLNIVYVKDNNTKLVQFITIFHLFNESRPTTNYGGMNIYLSS